MHAQQMFDSAMYTQLLTVMHLALGQAKISSDNVEAESVSFGIFWN